MNSALAKGPSLRASATPYSLRLLLLAALLSLAGSSLSACGEDPAADVDTDNIEGEDEQDGSSDGEDRAAAKPDAGKTRLDAGTPTPPISPPRVDASGGGSGGNGGRADAGGSSRDAAVSAPLDGSVVTPAPGAPRDLTPSPDNIKECPPTAPDNPVGSCIGVPIYATCSYTSYNCICDWYHWICI